MDTETTFWLGDTILRLDKILAVKRNLNKDNEQKPSNIAYVTLDNPNGTIIEVEFLNNEHASESILNLKQEWENYIYEQRQS